MCDHIATFLVAFDKQNPHEAVLKHFFDCNVGSFRIVAHAARPESGLESPNFVIWRDGNLVYVSLEEWCIDSEFYLQRSSAANSSFLMQTKKSSDGFGSQDQR
jgi:hypothetical protein